LLKKYGTGKGGAGNLIVLEIRKKVSSYFQMENRNSVGRRNDTNGGRVIPHHSIFEGENSGKNGHRWGEEMH